MDENDFYKEHGSFYFCKCVTLEEHIKAHDDYTNKWNLPIDGENQ